MTRRVYKQRPDIIVHCACPPIPDRRFDWCAYHDGEEEEHAGWGATAEEAIADLDRLDQERAEAANDNAAITGYDITDSDGFDEQQGGY